MKAKNDTLYVKISNSFIRYNKKSLLTSTQMQARLFLQIYLLSNFGIFRCCCTSIESLLRLCGVKAEKKHLKRSAYYSALVEAINWLVENNYIYPTLPNRVEDIPVDKIIKLECKMKTTHENTNISFGKFDVLNHFTKITKHEYTALFDRNQNKNKLTDLHVYAYIKSLILKRDKNHTLREQPQYCAVSHEQIALFCKLSHNTVSKAIQNLKKLNLIACKKPANIRKINDKRVIQDKYHNLKTVYVLKTTGYEEELSAGVEKYVKDNEKQFKVTKRKEA